LKKKQLLGAKQNPLLVTAKILAAGAFGLREKRNRAGNTGEKEVLKLHENDEFNSEKNNECGKDSTTKRPNAL